MMELSNRQKDILNEWENTDNNLVVSAVAGSGKSTTLLLLLEKCEYRTLIIAFNKSIEEELNAKIQSKGLDQGKAMTVHSMGLSAIRRTKKVVIDKNQKWNILKQVQKEFRRKVRLSKEDYLKLSYTLIDLHDVSRLYLTDSLEDLKTKLPLMGKFVFCSKWVEPMWERFKEIREESYKGSTITIDFTDMIYLPVKLDLSIPISPYYLFIDEAQDLNLCQHKLVDKLVSQGTVKKWIAVGDRFQSIYNFAGSLSNSFDMFLEKDNVKEMPLDVCYRCSSSIIKYANNVYDIMEGFKEDEGSVGIIEDTVDSIKDNSLVICRNSAPLFNLYFRLIKRNRRCYINGKDIMGNLIKFLRKYEGHTVRSVAIEMGYDKQKLDQDNSDEGKLKQFIFNENFNAFNTLKTQFSTPTDSIETLFTKLKLLFNSRDNAIVLCTIHKAKGLEADTVYILNENLIPSSFANSSDQKKQEKNLKYVARTRAKNEMYFLNLKM